MVGGISLPKLNFLICDDIALFICATTHAFNVPKCFDLFEMDWPFCARKWDLRLCLNYSQVLANLKWSSLDVVVGKIYFHHDPCGGISKSLCQVYFCLVCVVLVFLKFKLMCSKVVRFHIHKQIYSHWWLKGFFMAFVTFGASKKDEGITQSFCTFCQKSRHDTFFSILSLYFLRHLTNFIFQQSIKNWEKTKVWLNMFMPFYKWWWTLSHC